MPICWGSAGSLPCGSGWKAKLFNPWEDYLPRLERQMDSDGANLYNVTPLTLPSSWSWRSESAEVNEVFNAAVAATDAAFVRKLQPFRKAMEAHWTTSRRPASNLSPRLMLATRELRDEISCAPRAGV